MSSTLYSRCPAVFILSSLLFQSGVYDRDPRKFPDAVRFGRISYEKMLGLIENGAQVLHDRSVEFARDYGIKVEVLSAFTGNPGTIVG